MKRISFVLVSCMFAFSGYAQTEGYDNSIENAFAVTDGPTTDGLVAYYPFNGNVNDESGYQNHGSTRNASLASGASGNGYQFGGTSNPGHIYIKNSSSLTIGNGWTFAAYVKPYSYAGMDGYGSRASQGNHTILAHSHDRYGFCIMYNINGSRFSTWLGSYNQSWTSGINAKIDGDYLNQWIHVAYVYDNSEFRVFINGQRVTTKTVNPNFSTANRQDWYLGKFSDSWYPMNGALDEVRIYNRGLSDDEIACLQVF